MKQNQRYLDFKEHFSGEISDELKQFVIDEAMVHSRYLFIRRITSTIQRGYCTHCRKEHMITSTKPLKHNESWQCEKCKSLVLVKSAGRGRGKMFDKAYVIWYEKSESNPKAIVATGYNISFDYRDDFKGIHEYIPVARYVFEPSKATMMHRDYYYSGYYGSKTMKYEDGWSFARAPFTMIGKNSHTANSHQSIESVHAAVKDTSFVYSEWQKFAANNQDLIYFFTTFSKYPFIEYLTKMGMGKIVDCMVNGRELFRTINHRGKTMEKILGLSRKEIKDWKASNIIMDPLILHTYKWFRRKGVSITWETAKKCENLLAGNYYLEKLDFIQAYVPLEKIIRYALNQMSKDQKHYHFITSLISDWKDYLDECIELGMDLTLENVILPNSLYKAHQKTTRSIKVKRDEASNRKIAAMQPELKRYWFEYGDLTIRPAASSIEMFDEGKALSHCVGRYADQYAKGDIVIMFIRRKSAPEKSFYTLELYRKSDEIVQCRGQKNCEATPEVKAFLEAFKKAKLINKPKQRNRGIQERQGVAV
jgi:hypothetical protein